MSSEWDRSVRPTELTRHREIAAKGFDAMSMRHRVTESETGLLADWAPDSDKLVIGFRGLNPGKHKRFHFVELTDGMPVNKLWLRDMDLVWYHHGISGLTSTIDESAEYLAKLIAERGINRVVACGVSGGAYAALLFGWLLEFDAVIAISPQTFLGSGSAVENYDLGRYLLDGLMASSRVQREYFDLVPLLGMTPVAKSVFQIHYCDAVPEDRFHAERVRGLPGIDLHAHADGGHRLALNMAQSGELRSLLLDFLDLDREVA